MNPLTNREAPGLFIDIRAGLCNHLFQIAAGYAYAKRHDMSLIVPPAGARGARVYYQTYLRSLLPCISTPPQPIRLWREPTFSFTPIPDGVNAITGFFQSDKYFHDVSGEVSALFALPEEHRATVETRHAVILTDDMRATGIVVHVRRTDYIGSVKHGILDAAYYERAVAAARKKNPDGPLLVFSDDLAWCRAQPVFAGAIFVDEPTDYMALHLMSQYRHIVIANSTFSWWAAYLGPQPKTVIAPSRWFGPTGPADTADIYLSHWHLVDA
jgi:hypothetical protein